MNQAIFKNLHINEDNHLKLPKLYKTFKIPPTLSYPLPLTLVS
jgi:hypothetical protein